MSKLIVSISGLRGVIGESLTPEVIIKYIATYATYCNRGKIVVGRDGRVTGSMVAGIVSNTLMAMGCDVIDLGICPTPTVQLAVEKMETSGGISITASHNPMIWNGLKFLAKTGLFLNADENKKFWEIVEQKPDYVSWNNIGSYSKREDFLQQHIEEVLSLPYIHPDEIRKRNFRVVLDCVNAAGGIVMPQLLEKLGVKVIPLNCDVSGVFSHTPEPLPENLGDLRKKVVEEKANFGIAVDPDVDRIVFVDENGQPIGEEYSVTTAVKFILEKEKKQNATVAVNLSTTRAVDDVARAFGASVVRTPVGEINVATRMKEIGAIVGGEGSGGVILPRIHLGRDALVGAAIVIQQLAEFGGTMSQFRKTLPQYFIVKNKIELKSDPDAALKIIQARYSSEKITTSDGLKIDFADSWVHLRKSNTEPIIRIIAEGKTPEAAQKVVDKFLEEFKAI